MGQNINSTFNFCLASSLVKHHLVLESQIVGGCTIPGCYYPHYFSHHVNASVIKSMRVRGGRLSCQHLDRGTPVNRIECQLKCKKGWENANNVDVTICTKSQVEALARVKNLTSHTFPKLRDSLRKTTNFTTDYLECRRRMLTTPSQSPETTSSPHFGLLDTAIELTTQEGPANFFKGKVGRKNKEKVAIQQHDLSRIEITNVTDQVSTFNN